MEYLDPDSTDVNHRLGFFFYIIVYPKIADAEFPGRYWIRTHRLTISRFNSWLVYQLLVHRVQDNCLLSSSHGAQMNFGIRGVFNPIRQCVFSSFKRRRIFGAWRITP